MLKIFKKVMMALLVISIVLGIGIYFSLPMLSEYPKPTGKYAVGHQLFHINDFEQEFNVDVFYPSSGNKDQKCIYRPEYIEAINQVKAQAAQEMMKLPECFWKLLLPSEYKIYVQPDALIVQGDKFPVVVYLPGIASIELNILYLQELASHGYIVCSIEPPADVGVTIFPDGRKVLLDPGLKQAIDQNNREFIYQYRDTSHVRQSKYIQIVLDEMKKINEDQNSSWYHRLDLDNFGVLGFSHGGAVALDFCQKHNLCKAGIDMDGWTKTYNSSDRFSTPFLMLIGQRGGIIDIPAVHELAENNKRSDFYEVVIPDAGHGAFGDEILLKKPWNYLFGQKYGNAQKMRMQISHEIVKFFDRYLK